MTERSKKPARMRPWKGWCVTTREGYTLGRVWFNRGDAGAWRDQMAPLRIVRVEVRELVKPKKEKKAR